ncbi:MAG TPA: DUF1592 domain-containing protein [Polyangiaceae bacterium]
MARRSFSRVLVCSLALASAACTGEIDGSGLDDGATASGGRGGKSGKGGNGKGGSSGSGGASGSETTGGTAGTSGSGGDPAVAGVIPITRSARLTHAQYQAAILELFGIADSPSASFAPDATNGFQFDNSVDLRVDARLGPQYRAAAESVAERVAGDAAILARIVPCEAADTACPAEFVASFGHRAFRRPLTTEETTRLTTLFSQGPTLVASGDSFKDGVRLVVEAVLQSPKFLYRNELGDETNADGLIVLDDWEIASRLSFFLWNSIPDGALLDAAESGELSSEDGVRTTVTRLLADPKALATIVSFHAQAWQFARFSRIGPDADTYPDAPADLATRVDASARRFVEEVARENGGLSEFLTAPYAFADSELAPLYGKSVSGNALTRVDFTAGERKGFLMQLGFLASHAYAIKTDPIHRGLFVLRDLLCRTIPDPPAGASQTPLPETDEPIETTREEISLLTGQDLCLGCHIDINAPGFAFESFDAVGAARTLENDTPVDTTGELTLDGNTVTFADAGELVEALAQSSEAKSCYAGKWLSFAYGRRLASDDEPSRTALSTEPLGVEDTARAVATTRAFLFRAPNEVGQ